MRRRQKGDKYRNHSCRANAFNIKRLVSEGHDHVLKTTYDSGTPIDTSVHSCLKKKRFSKEHLAEDRANEYNVRHYYCENCAGWHLTRKSTNKGWL